MRRIGTTVVVAVIGFKSRAGGRAASTGNAKKVLTTATKVEILWGGVLLTQMQYRGHR
jgi:hypothetical protein